MPAFITRVRLHNYKSIADCDVQLGELTFVVGPNGSGKSNFLDALRLVADALNAPLDHVLTGSGWHQRRAPSGLRATPTTSRFARFRACLTGWPGHFAFEVHATGRLR
ncbi:MAG: AAA family ATPase [bacterium]